MGDSPKVIPVGKKVKFVIVFSKDSFASGQVLYIGLGTAPIVNNVTFTQSYVEFSTSCKIP